MKGTFGSADLTPQVDELRADLEESGELSVAGETLLSAISLCEVENARLMEVCEEALK